MSYQVGQTVFMVPSARWLGKPRNVVINKVGRIWVEIEDGRHSFHKETGRLKTSANGLGTIYASEKDYREEQQHLQRIAKIGKRFEWSRRDEISREQAIQIAEILGVKDDEEA